MKQHDDLCIIGAGAAGLMCAITAAKRGKSVIILDHAKKAAEKIRISGGGRCNFTNRYVEAEHYICANPHFVKSALAGFGPYDFIAMLEEHHIPYHEREHGQLFCDHSAQDIIDMLLGLCRTLHVTMSLGTEVKGVKKQGSDFHIQTSKHSAIHAHALVVATGGLSIPKIGASGFGYALAEQFSIPCIPRAAALVPFRFTAKEHDVLCTLAGIAIDAAVSCNDQSFREAMLFTHRGLSGPAILQISSYWQPGDSVHVDVLPGYDIEHALLQIKQQFPERQLHTYLTQYLPKRLLHVLAELHVIPANIKLSSLSDTQCQSVAQSLHHWQLKPASTEGYRTAEVTRGGVDTRALSSQSMEARDVPGLYFIGEVVDVTGHLGGYNFQWAWSSGYAAGRHI